MDRVVALGAWCGEPSEDPGQGSWHVAVHEFAVLADGRRLVLHRERGLTTAAHDGTTGERLPPWTGTTLAGLRRSVLLTVLPDDDADPEDHPWEWLRDLLARHGVTTTVDALRRVPYVVEVDEEVRRRLPGPGEEPA